MAEAAKRQSVAPSKASAPKKPSQIQELSKAVGARIRISTVQAGVSAEGIVFAADPVSGFVAVRPADSQDAPPNPNTPVPGDYHVLHISNITGYKILSPASSPNAMELPKLDTEALKRREEQAIASAKRAEASLGKGVTKEAQDLFDHISRTLPTRWNAQQIIVSDSVIIESPYRVENAKAPANKLPALNQVKRYIEDFWAKRSVGATGSKPGTPTPAAQGKGSAPPARAPVPAIPLGQRKGG